MKTYVHLYLPQFFLELEIFHKKFVEKITTVYVQCLFL